MRSARIPFGERGASTTLYIRVLYLHYTLYTLHAVWIRCIQYLPIWKDGKIFPQKTIKMLIIFLAYLWWYKVVWMGTNMMSLGDSRYYSLHNLTVWPQIFIYYHIHGWLGGIPQSSELQRMIWDIKKRFEEFFNLHSEIVCSGIWNRVSY